MGAISNKYNIKIGDIGFLVAKMDRTDRLIYSREEAPSFVNKFSSGEPNYRDATFFPHWVQLNWQNGFNQEFTDDGGKFFRSSGVDTTEPTKLTLQKAFNTAGQVSAGTDVLCMSQLPVDSISVSWADSNYAYRKQLSITAPAGNALPSGYPIKIIEDTAVLQTAGKVQADRDDWRVFYWNGTAWADLFRDYVGTTETWFALQAQIDAGITNTSYYIYYGYASEATSKQPTADADWNSVYTPADDANVMALYHVKETSGTTIADTSGNSNTLTLRNSATFAAGKFGKGLSVAKATTDYADASDSASLDITSDLTIEAFVKFTSAPSVGGYGADVLTGGTASTDSLDASNPPANAVDGNTSTRWVALGGAGLPHWWKYDLGAGVTKTITKFRAYQDVSGPFNAFTIAGSNDDSSYTTVYSGNGTSGGGWQDFTFSNSTAYRYYKFTVISKFGAETWVGAYEFEAMESLSGDAYQIVSKQYGGSANNASYRFDVINDGATKMRLSLSDTGVADRDLLTATITAPSTATWYHYSVNWVASTKTATFYINNVSQGTSVGTNVSAIYAGDAKLRIGEGFDGVIDGVRISNTARTSFLHGSVQDTSSDSYTKLLVHADGADGATTHTAVSGQTLTFSADAQLDTAQKQFGTASILFDGTLDKVTVPDSADWNMGTGDFTVDYWIRYNSVPAAYNTIQQYTDGNNRWGVGYNSSKLYALYVVSGASVKAEYTMAYSPSTGVWIHHALVRSGTNIYFFINGVSQTLTVATAIGTNAIPDLSSVLEIGGSTADGYINGWMDEIRVSKGVARWTSNFSVATSEYQSELLPNIGSEVLYTSIPSLSSYNIFSGLNDGKIYRWDGNTTWTEVFDTRRITWYETGNDANNLVGDDGGTEKAESQGFQIAEALTVKAVSVYLKKATGTPGDITVRIETDNAGVPSGTLANANATTTISAFTTTDYAWKTATFATAFSLSATTLYHIVCKTAAAANDNNYHWASDASSPSYTSGARSYSTNGGSTWTADATSDHYFRLLGNTTCVNCETVFEVSGTKYSYFGVGDPTSTTTGDARIYRTSDGVTFTLVKTFTDDGGYAVTSLCAYNTSLYAGISSKCKVYKSTDGSAFTLSKAITEPKNPGYIYSMVVYNNRLYVGGGHPIKLNTTNSAGFVYSYDDYDWKLVMNFDFTVVTSMYVYDNLLFIGTINKRLYVYNAASVDKILEFPWDVGIRNLSSWDDKLVICLVPTDPSNPTGYESVYLFDRNGFHNAFDTSNATKFMSTLSISNILLVGTGASGYVYKTVSGQYQASGWVQHSYYEAQLPNINKLYRSVTIMYDALPTGCALVVDYKTDETSAWVNLGTASTAGLFSSTFNFTSGIYSTKISVRVTFTTSDVSKTPTLRKVIMKYVLSPEFKYMWKMKLLCIDDIIWQDGTRPKGKLFGDIASGATTITLQSIDTATPTSGFPDPAGDTVYASVRDATTGTIDQFSYTGITATQLTGIPATGDYSLSSHNSGDFVEVLGKDLHTKVLSMKQAKQLYTFTDYDGVTYTVLFHSFQEDMFAVNQKDFFGGSENEVPITLLEA